MIRDIDYGKFEKGMTLKRQGRISPWHCQFELTYACPYDCAHCYSKCFDNKSMVGRELRYGEITGILDQIREEGCVNLTLTGGEPLAREDFTDIYRYAKRKGFLVSLFTNAYLLSGDMVNLLKYEPPHTIEVTVNGITERTYEKISGKKGSFVKVMAAVRSLAGAGVPLVIKSNGLRENRTEILKIKSFADKLLGKRRYKFDSFISPAMNGSLEPCAHRLTPGEILDIEKSDPDMIYEKGGGLKHRPAVRGGDRKLLYRCSAWRAYFHVDPYGRLKFCSLTHEFSADLRKVRFKTAFYGIFPKIGEAPFNIATECKSCELYDYCHQCPARSFLETGEAMRPVPYYCRLAKMRSMEDRGYVHTKSGPKGL